MEYNYDFTKDEDIEKFFMNFSNEVKYVKKLEDYCAELLNENMVQVGVITRRAMIINWGKGKLIKRPTTKQDYIDCVGWFRDNEMDSYNLDILKKVERCEDGSYLYYDSSDMAWDEFKPAIKSELKFYGDEK